MVKKEAKLQILFNQYLREKRLYGFYELKQTTKDTFYFNNLELHQYEGLQATEKEGLIWKLSDEDRRQKPCDTLCIPPLPSYVVIKYSDGFYFINIKDIVRLKEEQIIGITIQKAREIAERIVRYKNT